MDARAALWNKLLNDVVMFLDVNKGFIAAVLFKFSFPDKGFRFGSA